MKGFAMGTLDHMHLLVPDRYEAARWYQANLGFEVVDVYRFWADFEGGPLHISADGGKSALALFERGPYHQFKVETWVAFRVNAEQFLRFADGLAAGSEIKDDRGKALTPSSVVDHDACYAFYFVDPWGNRFELDCYEYDAVKRGLIEKRGITPVRFY